MSQSHSSSAKKAYLLVQFRYGDPDLPTFKHYIDTGPVPDGFSLVPTMKVEVPEVTGALKEKPVKIELPQDDFITSISDGRAFEPVYVRVYERMLNLDGQVSGGSGDLLFEGRVSTATQNYSRKEGIAQITAKNWKSRVDDSVNKVFVTNECQQAFLHGDCGSGLAVANFRTFGIIDSVAGKVLTCSGAAVLLRTFWNRGSIKVDQVSLRIKSWKESDPTRFLLTREPPASWVGKTATFSAGCSKRYEQCEEYENTDNFLAPGFATPDYLPVTETGREG